MLDVSPDDYLPLTKLMQQQVPGADIEEAPMLRGRLVSLNDVPVEEVKAPPDAQWVLQRRPRPHLFGDRCREAPRSSRAAGGRRTIAGEPLVSFETELAGKLGLKIGDTVTVNVLGRNVTARIANLREVKWESLAINFVMVFSPNTLEGAPSQPAGHDFAARCHAARDRGRSMRALARAYPAITPIRVRDALDAFGAVFAKVMIGGPRRRQRDAAGGRPRAGRRPGHRAAPPHPGGRHPEDAGRHPPAHPVSPTRSNTCCSRA